MNELEPVRVWRSHDSGPHPGIRHGNAVAYEFLVDPKWGTKSGRAELQRSFLLLDEGVDMAQPVVFRDDQADWWYIDLVRFEIDGNDIRRHDMYIDLIVGPPGQPYSVLDLDEFGAAITTGAISVTEASDALRHCQRFINTRLSRHHDVASTRWPAFPPREIESVVAPIPPLDTI